MTKFPFLRRPVRLILYAVLLALITTAALIFGWQYQLDSMMLNHAMDTYGYLGTIVRSNGQILDSDADPDFVEDAEEMPMMGGPAFLEEIPEELVQWLYGREDVARIDNRRTTSGLLGQYHRTKAKSNATGQTAKAGGYDYDEEQYWFLEGTVMVVIPNAAGEIAIDICQIQVDRMWNAPEHPAKQMRVEINRSGQESAPEVGQKVFLLGRMIYSGESGIPDTGETYLYTAAYAQYCLGNKYTPQVQDENAYTILPDGVDAEQYIQSLLASTGMDAVLERQLKTQYTVSLIQTKDMTMIPLFAQGKALTYEGRGLTPRDQGEKICVIPQGLAHRNNLSVGDTIQLAMSDVCYTDMTGRATGNPGREDFLPEYGAYEVYEIVGIYSQKHIRIGNQLYFSYDDIFVPSEENTVADTVQPYAFSIRISGPDYLNFQTDFQPVLDACGYSMIVEDTGWDDVKESCYTMQARRKLTLMCTGLAFGAAVAVFAVLLNAYCRYEYGLRRLLGASKGEAWGIYGGTFLFTALPGAVLAVAVAWYVAAHPMKNVLTMDLPLPTDGQCALTLAMWAGMELAAILMVLLGLSWCNERRGLLRLVRR